jgi:outer membrane lipoprotein-sorting protein
MKLADNIEKLIRDFRVLDVDTSDEMDQRIVHDALMAQMKLKEKSPASDEAGVLRMIMNNKMTKLAVAAVIVIGVLIGISQFGGSGGSVAWADVLEQMRLVETISYEYTVTWVVNPGSDSEESGVSQRGRFYSQDPGKFRWEVLDDNGGIGQIGISSTSGNERSMMIYKPTEGKWHTTTHSSVPVNEDELYRTELAWKILEEVTSEQAMKIGEKVIDGRAAAGFRATKTGLDGRLPFIGTLEVWVDQVTAVPIQVKGDFQQDRGQQDVFEQYVMQNIQWNTPLDDTLFQLPEGVEADEIEHRPPHFARTQLKDDVTLWLGPKGGTPVLTEKDLSQVAYGQTSIEREDGNDKYRTLVCFDVNEDGQARLRKHTREHINEKLLIDFNGEIIYEPTIRSEIVSRFIIVLCESDMIEEHESALREFEEKYIDD